VTKKPALPFIHRSFANEQGLDADNQRLEYLGDAILSFIISEHLYEAFPDRDEGFLSKARAALVSRGHLASKARLLKLDQELRLGVGEEKAGGRTKDSLLADTFEAYIAYLYLEKGLRKCRKRVMKLFTDDMKPAALQKSLSRDYKTALQEFLQGRGLPSPTYRILESQGPAHKVTFVTEVRAGEEILSRGKGGSKKEAEQDAARQALAAMEVDHGNEKDR